VTVIAARVADENDERQARTPVAEERVRVARELHDVVAHHIAVINVHAGLARRAAGRDARTVDTSLGHVQDAARTVLDELGPCSAWRAPSVVAGLSRSCGTLPTDDGGKVVWAVLDAPGHGLRSAVSAASSPPLPRTRPHSTMTAA
jgi:hypothetical protein